MYRKKPYESRYNVVQEAGEELITDLYMWGYMCVHYELVKQGHLSVICDVHGT